MTPEREAQMRDAFYKLLSDPSNSLDPESVWLACARALEPLVRDGERMRWLLEGNGFFMEEMCLCGYAPCSDEEKNAAREAIDAAMSASLERKNATE